jgi:hypothetical protein
MVCHEVIAKWRLVSAAKLEMLLRHAVIEAQWSQAVEF